MTSKSFYNFLESNEVEPKKGDIIKISFNSKFHYKHFESIGYFEAFDEEKKILHMSPRVKHTKKQENPFLSAFEKVDDLTSRLEWEFYFFPQKSDYYPMEFPLSTLEYIGILLKDEKVVDFSKLKINTPFLLESNEENLVGYLSSIKGYYPKDINLSEKINARFTSLRKHNSFSNGGISIGESCGFIIPGVKDLKNCDVYNLKATNEEF